MFGDYDEDLDDPRQRCMHGTFIGSWWGPDYLCGACEMGATELVTVERTEWIVEATGIGRNGEPVTFSQTYGDEATAMSFRTAWMDCPNVTLTITPRTYEVQVWVEPESVPYEDDEDENLI